MSENPTSPEKQDDFTKTYERNPVNVSFTFVELEKRTDFKVLPGKLTLNVDGEETTTIVYMLLIDSSEDPYLRLSFDYNSHEDNYACSIPWVSDKKEVFPEDINVESITDIFANLCFKKQLKEDTKEKTASVLK